MERAVGIDLGTTYSVAVLEPGNTVLTNSEDENTTPSVVFFSETDGVDEYVFDMIAKLMAATSPDDVVQFVKGHMGYKNKRFDATSRQSYTAEENSAIILKRLKNDAELALCEPVTDAVITVPAYFDDSRHTAAKRAGTIAGFNVLRVLNESTAAALSHSFNADKITTILVYDLGCGTFDVTVLHIDDLQFDVPDTDGNRNLGGSDFNNALLKFIAYEIAKQCGDGLIDDFEVTAVLREKSEIDKRTLSNAFKTTVFVTFKGTSYRVGITWAEFEKDRVSPSPSANESSARHSCMNRTQLLSMSSSSRCQESHLMLSLDVQGMQKGVWEIAARKNEAVPSWKSF